MMGTEELASLVRSMEREEFIRHVRSPFLLITIDPEPAETGFDTVVREPFSRNRTASGRIAIFAVEVTKAKGNPYPDRISIGRARNCDVVIRDPSVSKLHAHFKTVGGGFELADLGSQNGTALNGEPLKPHEPHPISTGDSVRFGTVRAKLVDAGLLYDFMK